MGVRHRHDENTGNQLTAAEASAAEPSGSPLPISPDGARVLLWGVHSEPYPLEPRI
jgi:hypothetical protein